MQSFASLSGRFCDLLGRLFRKPSRFRRSPTYYHDAVQSSEEASGAPVPMDRLPERPPAKVTVVDDATRRDLLLRLRHMLLAIEQSLSFSDSDLQSQLENSEYAVDRAASEFIERAGLRQVEFNTTLRQILAEQDSPQVHNAWSPCEATAFRVRCGPQYRKTKLKAQAKAPTLYSVIAVDVYRSDEKVEHMSRFMKLGDLEVPDDSLPLPQLFFVNFMLPLEEPRMPSLFGPAMEPNGPTVTFHLVMQLNEWTRNNLTHPSVELLVRFLKNCGDGGCMRERLKIIVQVANPDEMGLSRIERELYKNYNGLPFLFRAYNSTFRRGAGWFQADFDGHRSGYAARMARYALLGLSEKVLSQVGFLVEAETDDELPEKILGALTFHRIHCRDAKEFVRPSATPLSPFIQRKWRVLMDIKKENLDREEEERHAMTVT